MVRFIVALIRSFCLRVMVDGSWRLEVVSFIHASVLLTSSRISLSSALGSFFGSVGCLQLESKSKIKSKRKSKIKLKFNNGNIGLLFDFI